MANVAYDFEIVKATLTEGDKNRFVALFLNCQPNTIDWKKAADEFGSASAESMKVSTKNIMTKIEKAGGKIGTSATATPVKTTGGRKRKATGDGDGHDAEETPKAKKGRGRPKKAAAEQAA